MNSSSDAEYICTDEQVHSFGLPRRHRPRRPTPDLQVLIADANYVDAELDAQAEEDERAEAESTEERSQNGSTAISRFCVDEFGDEDEFEYLDLRSVKSRSSKRRGSRQFLYDELDVGNSGSDLGHDVVIGFSPRKTHRSQDDAAEGSSRDAAVTGHFKRTVSWRATEKTEIRPDLSLDGGKSVALGKSKTVRDTALEKGEDDFELKLLNSGMSGDVPPASIFGGLAMASGFFRSAFKSTRTLSSEKSGKLSNPLSSKTNALSVGGLEEELNAMNIAAREGSDRKLAGNRKRYIGLLEAQIATLNGAIAGFVDLALLRPMILKTCETISSDIMGLLENYGTVEMRIADLETEIAKAEKNTAVEVAEKEDILIDAKMSLAEAQSEVMTLEHELKLVRRKMTDPRQQSATMCVKAEARAADDKDGLMSTQEPPA